MNKLEVHNVSYSYDGKTNVIENINLTLGKGERRERFCSTASISREFPEKSAI